MMTTTLKVQTMLAEGQNVRSTAELRDDNTIGAVTPDDDNFYWPRVAQAGKAGEVSSDIDSKTTFGAENRADIEFFWHE